MKHITPMRLIALLTLLALILTISACGGQERPPPPAFAPSTEKAAAPTATPANTAGASGAQTAPAKPEAQTPTADQASDPSAPQSDRLIPYTSDGELYGYVDLSGQWVIEPQYQYAFDFVDGLASVQYPDGSSSYIDRAGKRLFNDPNTFAAGQFSEGLALVALTDDAGNATFGYIDPAGKFVIEVQFASAGDFSEGLAAVSPAGEKFGYIDHSGQFVIEPQFDYAERFSEGLAPVVMNKQYAYIDQSGRFVVEPQFDFGGPFSEGLAAVTIDGKQGFIDQSGQILIQAKFDYAGEFSDGLAVVNVDGQEGYIDQSGQFVIEPQFDQANIFIEGLAGVEVNNLYGYIDHSGQFVIEAQYQFAAPFVDGLAQVVSEGKIIYLDASGQKVLELDDPYSAKDAAGGNDLLMDVERTLLVNFLPAAQAESRDGSCFSSSAAAPQANAWRCTVDNSIYDPCFLADDLQNIVCDADPVSWEGFTLNLTEPLPDPEFPPEADPVWFIELGNGAQCNFAAGATGPVDGERINYLCSDQSVIAGEIDRSGPVWYATRAVLGEGATEQGLAVEQKDTVALFSAFKYADPEQLAAAIGLRPEQINFTPSAPTKSLRGAMQPAVANIPEQPPYLNGWPAHIKFTSDDAPSSPWFNPFQPQLRIFSLEQFDSVFAGSELEAAQSQVENLRQLLTQRPANVDEEIPLFPIIGASQLLRTQLAYLDFNGGSGIRFITYYAQDVSPITNEGIFYTFQGLTDDGKYYISFFHPASASSLPDTFQDAPAADDYNAFAENFETYMNEIIQSLNSQPSNAFTPNLDDLDAMLQSLKIGD